MKKLLLTLMLVVVSSSVMAEWVWVGKSSGNFTTYVDPTTIRKSGNKVKLWRLTDYKTAIKFTDGYYISSKSQMQYDCMEEQTRLLHITVYSENMGLGEAVGTNNHTSAWEPVIPESLGEIEWKVACGM